MMTREQQVTALQALRAAHKNIGAIINTMHTVATPNNACAQQIQAYRRHLEAIETELDTALFEVQK